MPNEAATALVATVLDRISGDLADSQRGAVAYDGLGRFRAVPSRSAKQGRARFVYLPDGGDQDPVEEEADES